MIKRKIHGILTYCIAAVWLVNGLVCKILDLVPRHQQIVARILGDNYSRPFTFIIGLLEVGMAIWILSGRYTRQNAVLQILIIATMNTLEFFLVPDLLLWGKMNSLFAFLFILVVFASEYWFGNKKEPT